MTAPAHAVRTANRVTIRAGFWLVFWREFRWLARRPFLVLLASVVPIAVFLILANVYLYGIATELPVAVLDLDDTSGSRQIVRLVDATADVRVISKVASLDEGRRGIVSGDYYGLLFIPEHFSRDVLAGRRPEISYFYNSQMLAAGNLTARGVSAALPAIAAQVQASSRMARGMTPEQAAIAIQPIPMQAHGLFNPLLDYSHFVLAALVVAVLQLTISLATCYSVALDVETSHRLRILRRLGGGIMPAILGKLLPLTIIAVLVHAVCDTIMFAYFGLPLDGSALLIVVSALIFILSCQFLAALFALLIKAAPAALSALGLILSPSFGYLGVSFPREAMNSFAQSWSNIFPATPYVSLRIDQTLRGTPVEASAPILEHQLIYIITVGLLLYLRLTQLKRQADTRCNDRQPQAVAGKV